MDRIPRKVKKVMFASPYGTVLKDVRSHKQTWKWQINAPDGFAFCNGGYTVRRVIPFHYIYGISTHDYKTYKKRFKTFTKVGKR